jgi:hypothetical protein
LRGNPCHFPEKTASHRPSSLVAAPPAARATVAIAFVQGMLAGLQHAGRDPAPLLERAHIATAGTQATRRRAFPSTRYAELYNLINRELDDEGFGLFSLPMRCGNFEFLCRSVITAPTLAEAIDRSIRFLRLVLPDLAVRLDDGGEQACLCISDPRPLPIGRVFAFEWLLRLLHGLFPGSSGAASFSIRWPFPTRARSTPTIMR